MVQSRQRHMPTRPGAWWACLSIEDLVGRKMRPGLHHQTKLKCSLSICMMALVGETMAFL